MPRKHEPYVYDRTRARAAILRIIGEPDIQLVRAPPDWRPPNALEALDDPPDLRLVPGPIRRIARRRHERPLRRQA